MDNFMFLYIENSYIKLFYLLLTILFISSCSIQSSKSSLNIIGGKNILSSSPEFKLSVALADRGTGNLFCSGTVINKKYILTAGHCVENKTANDITILFAFENSINNIFINAIDLHINPLTTRRSKPFHDLAIIELEQDIPNLYLSNDLILGNFDKKSLFIIGHGITTDDAINMSKIKTGVTVNIQKIISNNDNYKIITYENNTPQGACPGDSGAPAISINTNSIEIIGIVYGIDLRFFPQITNTNCSLGLGIIIPIEQYKSWITDIINHNLN